MAALIAAAGGIIVPLFIAGVFGGSSNDQPGGAALPTTTSGASAVSTSSATETSAGCAFAITAPRDFQEISAEKGVLVKGRACEGALVWLLDFDSYDKSYYQVNSEPLDIVSGRWGFLDSPIGDASDPLGTVYTIVALSASPTCSEALRTKKANKDGTVRFEPLPSACPDGSKPSKQVALVRVVKARR